MNLQIPWSETIVATALYIILNLWYIGTWIFLEISKKCLTSHRSIRRSVCHDREPCKNGWSDPRANGQFWGEKGRLVVKYKDSAVICAKKRLNVEPIVMQFRMWTQVGLQPPHHNSLRPLFRDHLGEPVPEENFWTLWCKGRLTEAYTPTIRLGATTSGLTIAHLHDPTFLQARCPSMQPNQQRQSTEGN